MSHRRTQWTLYAINFLNAVGGWFFLPLLPIFLGRKGGSAALVGVVFSAGLLSNALIRYPAGWAADRFDTRVVMVVALLGTAVLFAAYLLPLPLAAFIGLRFLQGAAQGSYWPAANAMLAKVTKSSERGQAYGYMQAANLAGMLIGPAIGGLIALLNLGVVFLIAGVLSGLATLAVATLPSVRGQVSVEAPTRALNIAWALLPLILLGAGTAYMIGAYDTIWSLYLTGRGANTFAVGLSFAAFAVPATLLSGFAGALGDRFGPRRFILVALLATGLFAGLYPFISSVPWLIGLGLIEGIFTISGGPSLLAEVSRLAQPGGEARTQGVFQTAQTLIQIVGALVAGSLFTIGPPYAFLSITAVCLLGVGTALVPRIVSWGPAHEST